MIACIRCGTPHPKGRTCPGCGYRTNRSTQANRSSREQRRRREFVDGWVRDHGLWCPGYLVPGHYVEERRDLTADHVTPISLGGQLEGGDLAVLCRGCNARKGGRNRLRVPSKRVRA